MGAYPPNVSCRSVIPAGTLVKLWAFSSGAASAISHESLKAPLWTCEPVRSLSVSLLGKCQDTSWRGHRWGPSARGSPASGPWVTCTHSSSLSEGMIHETSETRAYSLRSHQTVLPPANRKVQCLGLGLAFSVYGLFPVINLEPEGRVIAACCGAGRGAGGGDGGGMWAMPWKANAELVLPQGHFASAAKRKGKNK